MTKWKPRIFGILVGLTIMGLALVSRMTAQQTPAPPARQTGQRPAPPPPDIQAMQQLHQTYNALELVSVWSGSSQGKLPQDQTALFEQAKELYRQAHRAYTDRNYPRSVQLALAAGAASQGLVSILHANAPPIPNLPKPPEPPTPPPQTGAAAPGTIPAPGGAKQPPRGPADEARQILDFVRQRINDTTKGGAVPEPARAFLDASRKVYEQSRQAYQQHNYPKAIELALAAEAWTHVGDYVKQAANPGKTSTRPGQPAPPRP